MVFIEEFDDLDNRINQGLAKGMNEDMANEAGRLAHSLRGAASQIGALELSQATATVERAVRSDAANTPASLAAMGKLLADLIQSLTEHLARD